MKKEVLFTIVVVALLFLVACTSDESPEINSGLFSVSACTPPCWQNLIPGVSSINDVNQFINLLPSHKWPERIYRSRDSGCAWKRIVDLEQRHLADFHLENNTLTFIQWGMPPEITLQQVVDYYGSPEYFHATISTGPEEAVYVVEVYYPALGMAFKISPQHEDVNYIRPDMRISSVQYFANGDIKSYFTTRYSCDYGSEIAAEIAEKEITKYVQPWYGFGEIKVIPSP